MTDNKLIRQPLDKTVLFIGAKNPEQIKKATDLFDGKNATEQLKSLWKKRYGTSIVPKKNNDGAIDDYVIVSDGTDKAIDANRYETTNMGYFSSFIRQRSNIFNNKNQEWNFSLPETEEEIAAQKEVVQEPGIISKAIDKVKGLVGTTEEVEEEEPVDRVSEAESIWNDYRTQGKADLMLIRADRLSLVAQTSFMTIQWVSQSLRYEVISPINIYFAYGAVVVDSGSPRPVIPTEIEDSSAIIIRAMDNSTEEAKSSNKDQIVTSDVSGDTDKDDNKSLFYAYLGSADELPNGRYVVYRASEPEDLYENTGDIEIIVDEDNPYTTWSNNNSQYKRREYPFIQFSGSDAGSSDSIISTEGLDAFKTAIEFELSTNRCFAASNDAAIGQRVYSTAENTTKKPYPTKTCGDIQLESGQLYTHTGRSASEPAQSLETTFELVSAWGENHGVQGHLLTPDKGRAPQSGISLAIQSIPQGVSRSERAKQANYSIQRMFDFEKIIPDIYAKPAKKLPLDLELSWNPGEVELPTSPKEDLEVIAMKEDKNYISHTEALRQANGLDTLKEAEAREKEMFPDGIPKTTAPSPFAEIASPVEEEDEEVEVV